MYFDCFRQKTACILGQNCSCHAMPQLLNTKSKQPRTGWPAGFGHNHRPNAPTSHSKHPRTSLRHPSRCKSNPRSHPPCRAFGPASPNCCTTCDEAVAEVQEIHVAYSPPAEWTTQLKGNTIIGKTIQNTHSPSLEAPHPNRRHQRRARQSSWLSTAAGVISFLLLLHVALQQDVLRLHPSGLWEKKTCNETQPPFSFQFQSRIRGRHQHQRQQPKGASRQAAWLVLRPSSWQLGVSMPAWLQLTDSASLQAFTASLTEAAREAAYGLAKPMPNSKKSEKHVLWFVVKDQNVYIQAILYIQIKLIYIYIYIRFL